MDKKVYEEIYLIVPDNSLILADKLFVKTLRRFVYYQLLNNNLYRKFASSLVLPIMLDNNSKTTSVSCFIADLLSCECENFIFKLLY